MIAVCFIIFVQLPSFYRWLAICALYAGLLVPLLDVFQ